MRVKKRLAWAAVAGLAATTTAPATWSVIIVDTRTGEIAVGSATCLTGFDLRDNTPVLLTGIGAATAQSFVDQSGQNRVFIRDRLLEGASPAAILQGLSLFDPGHQTRQYGLGDTLGRPGTFSGTGAGAWAGGRAGQVGHLIYAVQGNVITGEPVVAEMERIIATARADLPELLMLSMEAARAMGGDGRCSCLTGPPPSCGAPPRGGFVKSAHIAYMMIARAGDRSGCNGLYRAGAPVGLAIHDFNQDGRPDVVAAGNQAQLAVVLNTTPPGSQFPTFAAPITTPFAQTHRDLVMADFNRDTILDIATCEPTPRTVSVMLGLGGTGFAAPAIHPIGAADTQDLVVADFDGVNGPDIAAANLAGNSYSVLLNRGDGTFAPAVTATAGGAIMSIEAADVDGDGDIDLVYPGRTINMLAILLNDGAGNFSAGPLVPVAAGPMHVVAGDFDGDLDQDFAVACRTGNAVTILRRDGGAYQRTDVPTGASGPQYLFRGEVTGDSIEDLVVVRASQPDLLTLIGQLGGMFTVGPSARAGGAFYRLALADLNGDGKTDIAAGAQSLSSLMTIEGLGGGAFNSGLGCATGDHYMNFNIPNTVQNDPDPVLTLRLQYDQWRAGLAGRPDATRTGVEFVPAALPAGGSARGRMIVTLRDIEGGPAPVNAAITVTHGKQSAGLATVGAVRALGGGVYEVDLTSGPTRGIDSFVVRIDDGVRPVVLMPEPTLEHTCPADCDHSTGIGSLDIFDFLCFQNAYDAREPYACDCDKTTGPRNCDVFDFLCFQNGYAAGCQ